MTKEFDPTRPCRYRFGEEPLAVFVLPTPQTGGETIVSVRRTGLSHTHHPSGRLTCFGLSGLDLINIPEEVEVVRWAVLDAAGTWMNSFVEENKARAWAGTSCTVVRLTGSYTR